jgi:AGZA family xanthine/uracil permease-like MFS transporter
VESRKTEAAPLDATQVEATYLKSRPRSGLLERIFKLSLHGTTVRTELLAGLTTFITMAYIIFVNPNIMADAGIDHGAAFVATCIAAALGCLLMGLYANWPVGLAPGMGLNAFFTYTVVGTMGYSWQTALGAVFISGVIFMILTLSRIREWLLNSIPVSLRFAMGAGVGLFLGLIGLKTAGIVVDSPATLIKLGSLREPGPLLAAICFLMIAVLSYHRVFGAILISIITVTLAGWGLGLVHYDGIFSMPPSLAPTWMAMDIAGVFNVSMISVVLAFLFVHMFDTAGTLMGVAQRAGLVNDDGRIENLSAPQGRQCVECVRRDGRRSASDQLCRERFGCGRRWSYRIDRCHRRRIVRCRNVLRAAGGHDPGLRHRRRADLCGDADDGRHGAHRVGRSH